jgi:aminomethyltransferase
VQHATALKRTPFHDFHRAAGARLIDFAGFEMPVRYSGDVREHQCVRNAVGLFDVSHMGEFIVTGAEAGPFLDRVVTNDVGSLEVGQALYTPVCRPDGCIVDDVLIYRFADRYMIVVNASNVAKDFDWFKENAPAGVLLEDRSDATALLALQGPKAPDVLAGHVPAAAFDLRAYRFVEGPLFGIPAVISRTGYTGEDGFELYFAPKYAATVWNGLMEGGAAQGIEPVGLGARDTLRLEMAYMLYGNDIDDSTTPLEAGLGWTVRMEKPDFIGRAALAAQKTKGLARRLVGFQLEGRRVARHGMVIESEGRPVGHVTSGTFSPSLERPIGLGYVEAGSGAVGSSITLTAAAKRLEAQIVKRPFYTRGSRKG